MDNDAKNLLLPVGTPVGPYIIRRHLGQNQCSATYLVEDTRKSGSFLWMIESLPVSLVKRSGSSVAPRQRKLAPVLQQAHASFVKSMREASMRPLRELHRGYSALQANGTNYVLLMPPSGTSLQEWMNSYAATPADHVRRFMDASLKALSAIHAAGLLHLDISPSTLFLHNNTVLFCGYGQPRQLLAQLCERPLTTPYYSAPELGNYATPPTAAADIFSLGATMRSLITRKSLPALRSAGDGLLLLSADDRLTRVYGAPLLACIDKALAVQPECRWQSVEEWALCLAEGRVPELIGMSAAEPSVEELPLDFTPPAVKTEPVTEVEPTPKQEELPAPVEVTKEVPAPEAKETPQQSPAPMEEESPRKPEVTTSPTEEPKQEAPDPEPVAPPTVAPASPEPDAPAPVKAPTPRDPKAEEQPAEKVETPPAEEHSIYDLMEKKNRNRKVTICAALAVLGLGALIATSDLLTLKKTIYVANLAENEINEPENNRHYMAVKALAESEGSQLLPICAKLEADIAELDDPEEKAMFMEELGLAESGLNRLIRSSYTLLGLISFLTAGSDECRAWTIKKGTKAPQAAGKIHTDFERGFIRAEVIAFEDMKAMGTMAAAKAKGLVRSEGKEYVMKDGDIVNFLFNV